ncbi:hypothetical protein [Sphingomonas profundi]|nr:hypothetical protein [Sphingomonas profundi]
MRRLRAMVQGDGGDEPGVSAPGGWRDDLRLFALTWAAGFLFFLILLA